MLLAVIIAKKGTISDLGNFAVAFSAYQFIAGLSRSVVTDSALCAGGQNAPQSFFVRRVMTMSLVAAIALVPIAALTQSFYLLAIAVSLPGLVLYDFLKALALGLGTATIALWRECAWTAGTIAVTSSLLLYGAAPKYFFLAWAFIGSSIGFATAVSSGYSLKAGWGRSADDKSSLKFGLHYLGGGGAAQLATSLLAATAGVAVAGAIRGAGTVLGPANLVVSTLRGLLIPFLTRASEGGRSAQLRLAVAGSTITVLAVLPLAFLPLLIPDWMGTSLLGSSWYSVRPVLPFLAFEVVFAVVGAVAFAAHRVKQAGSRGLAVGSSMIFVRLGLILWSAVEFGARGAAAAMAAVAFIGALVWWFSYMSILKKD